MANGEKKRHTATDSESLWQKQAGGQLHASTAVPPARPEYKEAGWAPAPVWIL